MFRLNVQVQCRTQAGPAPALDRSVGGGVHYAGAQQPSRQDPSVHSSAKRVPAEMIRDARDAQHRFKVELQSPAGPSRVNLAG